MRFTLAIFCILSCGASAHAQNGVSNVRDGNGNIVRDTGMNPVRGGRQAPSNIINGPIDSVSAQPSPAASAARKTK